MKLLYNNYICVGFGGIFLSGAEVGMGIDTESVDLLNPSSTEGPEKTLYE